MTQQCASFNLGVRCHLHHGHSGDHYNGLLCVTWPTWPTMVMSISAIDPELLENMKKLGQVIPGPRKPVPALPVEVYSSKQFDKDAAWAAVVALSRGS